MRSKIPFDTHAFVKDLVAAGVPEAQAEVHARMLGEVVVERLATKDDIGRVRDEIDRLREELRLYATKADLKDVELRLTVRFGGMLAAAVAVLAVLQKLL